MCRRVQCSTCDKPTYAGCGAHIDAVLADVPKEQRCHCREDKKANESTREPSALRRFFGL